ncbi:MAG TPA: hypothetical protein VGR37_00575 [Longimicrobiaceae bacterium]|nr:hypothetical protein [Longimicrobiaceae bacterium]
MASRRRAAPFLAAFALLLLAACGGDNLFAPGTGGRTNPGTGGGAGKDTLPPTVAILAPLEDALIAAGDSLTVRVAVADANGLAGLELSGFSVAAGGNVERFARRSITMGSTKDTVRADTVRALLVPTGPAEAARVFVVARITDLAGNTRADTVAITTAIIRGQRIPLEFPRDRIVDMVSDGERLFLSNFTRNRVEVLDLRSGARSSFRVGSQPWGLALSPDSATLYVANSGGTNISVVNLAAGALAEDESRRIQTPNIHLFDVPFTSDSVDVVDEDGRRRKIAAQVPSKVTVFDYSDRPQFIAQTVGGELLYSTVPTGTAPVGTLRRRRTNGVVEMFVDYARRDQTSKMVIVNALDAGLIEGKPNRLALVTREGVRLTGFVDEVRAELLRLGSETRFEYHLNLDDIGLRDTTFVSVSGDHRSVAFGEGAVNPGRIILFREAGDGLLVRSGDTRDLVNNAAERVIGLGLNRDGTLGAARGRQAYFFDPALRLLGVTTTGAPFGGLALHPGHQAYPSTPAASRLAFVPGRDENGSPYLDVLDTFNFFRRTRVFLRDLITGPVVVAPAPAGSGQVLRVYGITADGLLRVDLGAADLQ